MWKHHSTPKPFWVDSAESRVYLWPSVFCIRNQPRKGKTKNRAQEEGISIASRRSVAIWKESYRSRVDRLIPICMIHIFNFNALKPSAEVLREWMFSFRYANCVVSSCTEPWAGFIMVEHAIRERNISINGRQRRCWLRFASSNSVGAAARDGEEFKQKTAAGNFVESCEKHKQFNFSSWRSFSITKMFVQDVTSKNMSKGSLR